MVGVVVVDLDSFVVVAKLGSCSGNFVDDCPGDMIVNSCVWFAAALST